MKKNKETNIKEDEAQSGKPIKDLPIKTAVTDDIKNSASQTPGLNQAHTTRDDLFPSDGDILTNR